MSASGKGPSGRSASIGGFTLVEVMVALVVLATGALALTKLSLSVALLMRQSSEKTELIASAENRLEAVQALDFDNLVPVVDEDTIQIAGKPYVRRTIISDPNPRTRQIEVTLSSPVTPLSYSTLTYVSAP